MLAYNANGAMTKDQNKGMTVEYNILNLPKLTGINNPISNEPQIIIILMMELTRSVINSDLKEIM